MLHLHAAQNILAHSRGRLCHTCNLFFSVFLRASVSPWFSFWFCPLFTLFLCVEDFVFGCGWAAL